MESSRGGGHGLGHGFQIYGIYKILWVKLLKTDLIYYPDRPHVQRFYFDSDRPLMRRFSFDRTARLLGGFKRKRTARLIGGLLYFLARPNAGRLGHL